MLANEVAFDYVLYAENRRKFPSEELFKYEGQHVAFSLDGTQILASGTDLLEVDRKLIGAGINPSCVILDYVDPPDVALLL